MSRFLTTLARRRKALSPVLAAHKAATGISAPNARRVDNLLTRLTAAAGGVAPVFLWVAGSDYTSADCLKTVIGGDLTLQGGNATAPTVNAKSLRTTRSTKFLRGANPTAADTKWSWAVWADHKDETTDHILLSLRNLGTTERGPHLVLTPQGATPATAITSSTAGTGNNANLGPVSAGAKCLKGPSFTGFSYDPADTGLTWRAFFNATYEARNLTIYNSHAFVRIGGIDDTQTLNYTLSNCEYYAVAGWDTDLTEAQLAAVRIALYDSGVQPLHTSVPALLYLGDSTMGTKWNLEMHGGAFGGAWRDRAATGAPVGAPPGDMGGKDFAWHYGLKDAVIQTLRSLPYQDRYFVYGCETPTGMGGVDASWATIGVTEDDADGFYAVMEQWLLEIEAATGCQIVICSYIQGTTAGVGEDDRNRVAAMAAANPGWIFVDLWNEPHSRIPTTAHGFYFDPIHQDVAGSQVQAEYVTSVLSNPNMPDAPRFDVANPPAITGTPTSGSLLSCSVGTPHVAGTSYTYQWLRKLGVPISGATAATYTLQAADVGNRISCRVTAAKAGQPSASFTSAPTAVVS